MSAATQPAAMPRPDEGGHRKSFLPLGAVGTAFLAALCCLGPLIFVTLGVGAGLASTFKPLQPVFTVLTLVLIAAGFYAVYGRRRGTASAAGATATQCATPRGRGRDALVLWVGTIVALILVTFPQWSFLLV